MKTIVIILVISLVGNYFLFSGFVNRGIEIDALEGEKIALQDNINRLEKNYVEISERKKKTDELAKLDKTGFDWGRDLRSDPVSMFLRKNCKSCSHKKH